MLGWFHSASGAKPLVRHSYVGPRPEERPQSGGASAGSDEVTSPSATRFRDLELSHYPAATLTVIR
jgi:hypothetical protein